MNINDDRICAILCLSDIYKLIIASVEFSKMFIHALKEVKFFYAYNKIKDDITNDSLNHAKFASNNLNKNIKLHFHHILTS